MKLSVSRLLVPALVVAASTGVAIAESEPSADATLGNMLVSAGTLLPPFSPAPKERVVEVPNKISTLAILSTASHPQATITVNGQAVLSGKWSPPQPLEVGRNFINVKVTAPNGLATQTYVVKVLRAVPTVNWKREIIEGPFSRRDSAGELVFNDRMWLLGGWDGLGLLSDVWSSTDGVFWNQEPSIPTTVGLNIPPTFVHQGKMWVIDGNGGLFASSTDGSEWQQVSPTLPFPRRYAAGYAVFQDQMWVLGGAWGTQVFNDVWSSIDGVTWQQHPTPPWSPRQLFGNVIVKDNKLWVIGGGLTYYQPFRAYRDVWKTKDGVTWEQMTDEANWPPRIWSCTAVYRNRMFMLGGFEAYPKWDNFNDVSYSGNGKKWKRLMTDTIWQPRHQLSAFVHQNKLWVVSGNMWPLMNDVWSLDIPGMVFLSQPIIEALSGTLYTYHAEADFNLSGMDPTYELVSPPSWLTIDAKEGMVSGIAGPPGDYDITIKATDNQSESAEQTYTLHVLPIVPG